MEEKPILVNKDNIEGAIFGEPGVVSSIKLNALCYCVPYVFPGIEVLGCCITPLDKNDFRGRYSIPVDAKVSCYTHCFKLSPESVVEIFNTNHSRFITLLGNDTLTMAEVHDSIEACTIRYLQKIEGLKLTPTDLSQKYFYDKCSHSCINNFMLKRMNRGEQYFVPKTESKPEENLIN